MFKEEYFVYIISSLNKTLYIGITNDLKRRIWEHKLGLAEGFSKKYQIKYLVYYEILNDSYNVITREKQLKKWRREKKIKLIESVNPEWKDLYFNIG
jgi:putative endonuclease